ncbi:MAG: hypothetical protein A3D31_10925 [Candidatus Fluviicola riflensis]|nr:MAG: hypothetical protein CHH17_15345 [Candidatus Fluviicola riflensis]OGS77505.1 MAG: hypothetical protein A3D31_10925 [Candidatus Fluviicola riflensis]OGS84085.1 MAG: hypothetical protein A3E30_12325 [Fluviicola sp. RIFCSPHIGHO2_12_FULL_43_24]OGS84571.1 MAG: hypothetical protein A2724_07860 [Fluviicola sp. RIFCSPHIGHO2_01_FULL_43_53]
MKIAFLSSLFFLLFGFFSYGQADTLPVQDTNTYRIVKTDGGEFLGKILTQDAREILLLTQDNRKIYIPQYMIKEIILLEKKDFNNQGEYVGDDAFATRYFLNTNGLPIKKGEHYVQWNLFGPDFQFGVGKNFGIGLMTSWVGMPIIVSAKKSFRLSEKSQFAIGTLAGTGTWAGPDFGGLLPFGVLSFGDRKKNIAFSGGYGAVWVNGDPNGRAITSVAGMFRISQKVSFVFDSFVLFPREGTQVTSSYGYTYYEGDRQGFALIIPGIRWHQDDNRAFQFGFVGLITDGEIVPFPIPMVQWYRKL